MTARLAETLPCRRCAEDGELQSGYLRSDGLWYCWTHGAGGEKQKP